MAEAVPWLVTLIIWLLAGIVVQTGLRIGGLAIRLLEGFVQFGGGEPLAVAVGYGLLAILLVGAAFGLVRRRQWARRVCLALLALSVGTMLWTSAEMALHAGVGYWARLLLTILAFGGWLPLSGMLFLLRPAIRSLFH